MHTKLCELEACGMWKCGPNCVYFKSAELSAIRAALAEAGWTGDDLAEGVRWLVAKEPRPSPFAIESTLAGIAIAKGVTSEAAEQLASETVPTPEMLAELAGKCGKRCDHDSPCTLPADHDPGDRHETEHRCVFYDARPIVPDGAEALKETYAR